MKCQILLSGEKNNKENISMSSAENFAQSAEPENKRADNQSVCIALQ